MITFILIGLTLILFILFLLDMRFIRSRYRYIIYYCIWIFVILSIFSILLDNYNSAMWIDHYSYQEMWNLSDNVSIYYK